MSCLLHGKPVKCFVSQQLAVVPECLRLALCLRLWSMHGSLMSHAGSSVQCSCRALMAIGLMGLHLLI
jgi:hypothetical protein